MSRWSATALLAAAWGTLSFTTVPAAPTQRAARESETLRFTFIGNMAVHVTDGDTVLVTDFPYESGAFGYMKWRAPDVPPLKDGLALITHSHRDHFAPELLAPYDLTVAGAPEVRALVKDKPTLALDPPLRFRAMEIQPRPTPHAGREHFSYVVVWLGLRLYFTGDTEDPADLLAARDLDVAFVSPWLFASARRKGARIDARRLVIYHHQDGQAIPGDVSQRTVPRQGEVIVLQGR
jgi:L-ascorbate metabolism protein UlaG (beta-lactamase superfamily)